MHARSDHIRWMAALVLALAAASYGQEADETVEREDELRGRPPGILSRAFRAAARDAVRKLHSRRCEEVFDAFADAAGVPLRSVLLARRETPAEHFHRILFYDGANREPCRRPGILASTSPGGVIVFVCFAFGPQAIRNPGYTSDILIHEELHTLGLGENPPSSAEITSRVAGACD